MKIKQITRQSRRDFMAIYECEGCGYESPEKSGYDDYHFHEEVIPRKKCPVCGKTSAECGANYRPLKPRYPEGYIV
jgi:predicted RNA-binding Zn-ribbon protein involved in translation (DUF1610 family)